MNFSTINIAINNSSKPNLIKRENNYELEYNHGVRS